MINLQNTKHLLLPIFLFGLKASAQQSKLPIPEITEFVKYLHARQHDIMVKLYDLAINGNIKAYRTDSMSSFYNTSSIRKIGSTEFAIWVQPNPDDPTEGYDSVIQVPFSAGEISGVRLLLKSRSDNKTQMTQKLRGLALLYTHAYAGIQYPSSTLFWINYKDLLANLSENELSFVLKTYYYGYHSHYPKSFNKDIANDPFEYLNLEERLYLDTDSSLFKGVASMLSLSNFYIINQIYSQGGEKLKLSMLFDEQENRLINIDDYHIMYPIKTHRWVQTNPDDPSEGYDTLVIFPPEPLRYVRTVTYDTKTKKIDGYELISSYTEPIYLFSIKVDPLFKPASNILWFYEDYIRWKGL